MPTSQTAAVAAAQTRRVGTEAGVNRASGGEPARGNYGANRELASEEAVGRCVEDLEKLLTAAPAPPALMGLLSDVRIAVPLFRLHCFCKK